MLHKGAISCQSLQVCVVLLSRQLTDTHRISNSLLLCNFHHRHLPMDSTHEQPAASLPSLTISPRIDLKSSFCL